jgi:hypothetical protein
MVEVLEEFVGIRAGVTAGCVEPRKIDGAE